MSTEKLASQLLISKELVIAFLSILIWDFLATLQSEIQFIWKARWTPLKITYLINRYGSLTAQVFAAIMLLSSVPLNVCKRIFWIVLMNGIGIILICDLIVAIRVWTIWERTRRVGALLLGCLVAELVIMINSAWQLKYVSLPPAFADVVDFHGCTAGNAKHRKVVALLYWTPTLLFNALCLGMIFAKHVKLSRKVKKLPIMQRLMRDGIFYFIIIIAVDIPNIYFCESDMGLESIWIFASLTLKSIMASRMVLSLLATGAVRLVSDPVEKQPLPSWTPAQATSGSSSSAGGGVRRATLLPTLNYSYQPTGQVSPITVPVQAATSTTISNGASLSSSTRTGETSSWTSASPNPASTMTGLTSIGSQGGDKEGGISSEVLLMDVTSSGSSLEEENEKGEAEK